MYCAAGLHAASMIDDAFTKEFGMEEFCQAHEWGWPGLRLCGRITSSYRFLGIQGQRSQADNRDLV